jgi:hypothetical protein
VPALHGGRGAWKQQLRAAPARVQWDPERDLRLNPLPYRSLQLGLGGEATARYADEWIVGVEDVTPLARETHARVRAGELERAAELLPKERPYPVGEDVLAHLAAWTRPSVNLRCSPRGPASSRLDDRTADRGRPLDDQQLVLSALLGRQRAARAQPQGANLLVHLGSRPHGTRA